MTQKWKITLFWNFFRVCFSFKYRTLTLFSLLCAVLHTLTQEDLYSTPLHTQLTCPLSVLHILSSSHLQNYAASVLNISLSSLSLAVFDMNLLGTVQRREECFGVECTTSSVQPHTQTQTPPLRLSGAVWLSKLSQSLCKYIWEHC